MDYSTRLPTSLDLNVNPLRLLDDTPVRSNRDKEAQSVNSGEVGSKLSPKEETSALVEELQRVSAENKRLTEMLTVVCENYNALRRQMMDYISNNPPPVTTATTTTTSGEMSNKKRKAEGSNGSSNNNLNGNAAGNSESSSSEEDFSYKKPKEESIIKAKISRVYVRTEGSDTSLIVKDGYQWRKYGQKVTRDNPSPRAYFKCSFAPSCPVKKKVQRSVEDQTVVVATYEGEHNHPQPCQQEATPGSNRSMSIGSIPCSTSLNSSGPTITLDLTKPKASATPSLMPSQRVNTPEFQKLMAEQMASSLTKDPNFTAALAAAISGRFLSQNSK
ncbi:WRKY transcription factor [Ancistrocladus abbreviatus]